ncbi:MAG: peptidylprolyl isomerase [Bacteroidetes bacterium]|nr:MAG: peptidylprolyl isomerase [Bacteroidota bacterium]
MIKHISLLSLGVLLSAMLCAQRAIIDKVVAMVGGEIILLSEVEEQYSLSKAQNPTIPEDFRCTIIDQLLVSNLLVNQARLDSIVITDAELEDQLNARIDRILAYMNGDVRQFEDYYGKTVAEVKEQFRSDLEAQVLAERMRAKILANVKVTPSEVKAFFNSIPKDSLPYFNSEVEIGEIVYVPPVNEQEKAKARLKLENIREQIVTGAATFEEMARKYSDDGSARIGGDLGWAKRGKFVPEFEAAAYQLEVNEISPVIESPFGFHIIQMLERRGNTIHVRHILIKPEITEADLELAYAHLDSVRMLILNDSITFSQAVKRFGNDEVQSYTNDGRMINPVTGNTFFEIGDLDPDIYFTIDTMEVGEVSAPFSFRSPTGELHYRIVQLQSRTEPHRANLQQDYYKIQQATEQSKQNIYLSEWVEDHVRSTYIMIDELYDSCPNLDKWRKDGRRAGRVRP